MRSHFREITPYAMQPIMKIQAALTLMSNAIWIPAFTSDTNMCIHSYEYVHATRDDVVYFGF